MNPPLICIRSNGTTIEFALERSRIPFLVALQIGYLLCKPYEFMNSISIWIGIFTWIHVSADKNIPGRVIPLEWF